MACFVVSAAGAAVATAVEKAEEKKELAAAAEKGFSSVHEASVPLSRKLKWYTYLLWGGVILLAFEHIWHGEVVPWFPFLTAMGSAEEASVMFHEMATVGVAMFALITIVWLGMCFAADAILRRPAARA
ncbi:MAG: hypothetical protein J6P05_02250 [Lachnospiraceae bacterium]|nr:hypothetical protein [Lachnospiraceae bacterium]